MHTERSRPVTYHKPHLFGRGSACQPAWPSPDGHGPSAGRGQRGTDERQASRERSGIAPTLMKGAFERADERQSRLACQGGIPLFVSAPASLSLALSLSLSLSLSRARARARARARFVCVRACQAYRRPGRVAGPAGDLRLLNYTASKVQEKSGNVSKSKKRVKARDSIAVCGDSALGLPPVITSSKPRLLGPDRA